MTNSIMKCRGSQGFMGCTFQAAEFQLKNKPRKTVNNSFERKGSCSVNPEMLEALKCDYINPRVDVLRLSHPSPATSFPQAPPAVHRITRRIQWTLLDFAGRRSL